MGFIQVAYKVFISNQNHRRDFLNFFLEVQHEIYTDLCYISDLVKIFSKRALEAVIVTSSQSLVQKHYMYLRSKSEVFDQRHETHAYKSWLAQEMLGIPH